MHNTRKIIIIEGDAIPVGFCEHRDYTPFSRIEGSLVRAHLEDTDNSVWFLPGDEFATEGTLINLLRSAGWNVTPAPMTKAEFAVLTEPVTVLVQDYEKKGNPLTWYWEELTATAKLFGEAVPTT